MRKPETIMLSSFRILLFAALLVAPFLFTEAHAQSWTDGPPMGTARANAAVAVLDGELYVIGGENTTGQPLGVVERYDPVEEEWETVESLREERHSAAASILNGKILLMGGTDDSGEATDDVEIYVPGEDDWESFDHMDEERNGLASAVLDGLVFALGGTSESGGFLTTCEAYNPGEEGWYPYAQWALDPGRALFGAATVGDAVYMAGGFSQFGGPIDLFERYTLVGGSTVLAPLSSPRGNLALVSTGGALGGDLFAIGGGNGNDVFDTVERYDIEQNAWEPAEPLQTAREGAVAAYLDGAIYVVGGRNAAGNVLSAMEVYRFPVDDEEAATPTAFALEAAYPNPFSDRTTLTLHLTEAGPATLTVYDVRGRAVATLVDGVLAAGEHRLTWDGTAADGRALPAGMYVARLTGSAGHAVTKLTLLR